MLANVTLVIDRNGQFREQAAGTPLRPGEVVVQVSDDASPQVTAELVNPGNAAPTNLDGEIAQILQQIQQGADPTQNPELATAAGGQNGSSPTATGSIDRTGDEVLAATNFETQGLQGLGLSSTQSLALTDFVAEIAVVDTPPAFNPNDPENVNGPRYSFSYDENRSDGDVIGVVQATDAEGESVTYAITTNVFDSNGNTLFEIDEVTGEISLTAAGVVAFSNDFEQAPNVHDIIVTATEVDGLGVQNSTSILVELSELNLDEFGPVFDPNDPDNEDGPRYVFSYDENSSDEYVIGTVSATDGDGEAVTYSITTNVYNDANEALFEIDAVSGAISLTAAGVTAFSNDYETAPNVHDIVVTATEVAGLGEQKSTDITVELSELNLDEFGPVFDPNDPDNEDGPRYVFSYDENSSDEYVIGTVSATDGDGEAVTYSITTNVYNDANEALFEIDAVSGAISLTAAGVTAFSNDYETAPNVHDIVVTATEVAGLGEQKSTDITVELSELNLDEFGPVFDPNDPDNEDGPRYVFSYDENSSDEYVIGTVSATDGDGEAVTYSITTNVYNDANEALFEIDAVSGAISLTAAGVTAFSNDYETAPNVHDIVVTATEVAGLGEQKSTDITVELSELNLDEFGPVFDPNDPDNEYGPRYVFSYDENSSDEYVIGTVSATDGDGEAVTYSITTNVYNDANEALFEIDAVSGAISLTAAGVTAFSNDYETAPNVHDIVVTATEVAGLGEQKSTDITVELSELNLDEFGPVFDPNDQDNEDGPRYVFSYDENSSDEYVIGTVSATDGDGEAVMYSITTNVYNDANEALFEIDAVSGAISLTAAGVTAFSNDFEDTPNVHTIQVMATEVEGLGEQKSTVIDVQLSELNLDDNAPIFDDEYIFTYEEDSEESDLIGTVSATDADGESVTYSIKTNVYDSNNNPLFWINATTGAIYLTSFGVLAFTNDFEQESNIHNLVVTATEVDGLGAMKSTDVDVVLKELNVNEPPVAEDFTVLLGNSSEVTIVFDSDVEANDHISDVDDDFTGTQLNIVLTSLPDNGTLLYTDENGVTRELTSADVYVSGQLEDPVLLNPNNITYVPEGNEVVIGSTDDGSLIPVDDDYQFVLDNGNTIYISAFKTLGNGSEVSQQVTLIETVQQGTGLSVATGNGINSQETLHVDLSENPLYTISFGVDGLNTNHAATVTYYFENSDPVTISYQGNGDYSYTASSDDPVIGLDFTASNNDGSSGANYVVTHLSGTETVVDDSTFTYQAVDSDGEFSNVATVTLDTDDSTPSYHVFSAEAGDPVVNATVGNDVLIGDSQANVFTWLDSALDNSTDVVKNFEFNTDKLDLSAVLDSGEDFNTLLSKIDVLVGAEDVTLQVSHDSGETQSIVIDNGVDIFGLTSSSGLMTDDVAQTLLSQIVKTETV
ncbi:cadherin repeat domain-containing protein [Vibrio fluvialis]|nr:cadherin repeat domain-containing protein [Vibrio fluvialis]MBL4257228.1 cadherin repeat domain-containing protein [Vibrio fluvialis]MBL4285666.1 cadherin repeat domain-containing protein [Vibrio fluvialis]MBL4292004.1 cadherin repeat domain-containing protein [Vibrio fluvialis]MBY8110620.1 cadherin repeat domain-containing protein [Vibrio fluvialis]